MAGSRKTWSLLVADPSLIFGLISTGIFYSIILQPGMSETQLARFTSEHAVEYVIVTLFFWGMVDIIMKLGSPSPRTTRPRHPAFPLPTPTPVARCARSGPW